MELRDIPGIGDKTASAFEKTGIHSIRDLLTTYPRTYRHYNSRDSKSAQVGEWVALTGTVSRPASRHTGRLTTQVATFWDAAGSLTLRWFNMPFLSRSISTSSSYLVLGRLESFRGRRQIVNPTLRKITQGQQESDLIVPIYRSQGALKPWVFRQKIAGVLSHIEPLEELLPQEIIAKYSLIPYFQALQSIHQPRSEQSLEQAVKRLSFQELFDLQLRALEANRSSQKPGYPMRVEKDKIDQFHQSLPFELTKSQISAIGEILFDLEKDTAMQRLLQGEVGSGKTVVAETAALATHLAGFRTIVMAPTQILANQLFENLQNDLTPLGIKVSLVTAKSRGDINANILVGTQALLQRSSLKNIGLVIVDEQHRFGVEQRKELLEGAKSPHYLEMTATPIPRSLASTLFRGLDISRLPELPHGRLPVKTYYVPESKRRASYDWIKAEVLSQGTQVFIVTPLIEVAEEQDESPLKSVKELSSELSQYFPNLKVDIMHGKMKEDEKLSHMKDFKNGITQVLVATSMIEVGLDIPQANIIVIEDAERFGLAQLHQLRGRVGRGGEQGHCLLFSSSKSPQAHDRLAYFLREKDGEKLAYYDLQHRGPGELFGTLQSGFFNLALGSMYDQKMLEDTYQAARQTLSLAK